MPEFVLCEKNYLLKWSFYSGIKEYLILWVNPTFKPDFGDVVKILFILILSFKEALWGTGLRFVLSKHGDFSGSK